MISIIVLQMPLLSTLFCICLCSYTLIWCRIIPHWICVLVSVFVLASLLLLSKSVWPKFLFGYYCFLSQRSEFAFVSLIFGHLFLSTGLAFQFPLLYSGTQWYQSHPDWAWPKKKQVPRVADSHWCQNCHGLSVGHHSILLTPEPYWQLLLMPQERTGQASVVREQHHPPCSSHESRRCCLTIHESLPAPQSQLFSSEEQKSNLPALLRSPELSSDAIRLKHCLLYTSLNIPLSARFHSHCLGFVMIWIICSLTVIRLKY